MTSSSGKRVFTIEMVRGSTAESLVRLIHDQPFEGSEFTGRMTVVSPPEQGRYGIGGFHFRILPMREAAAIINADIAAGSGSAPLTTYVDTI